MKTNKIYKFLCYAIGSVCGVGYCPFASGTAGSLVTLPLAFAAAYYFGLCGILVLASVTFFLGLAAAKEILKYTKHDPSLIVIDEVVGQVLAFSLLANLLQDNLHAWPIYVIGFVLFRLFDIVKPAPVGWVDRKILNAFGVMFDDVLAGLYAAICLYIINIYAKIL